MIGAGWIAHTHAERLRELPAATLTAVADVELGRARELAQEPAAAAYESWAEMLHEHERGLDAVFVCTPPQHHREATIAALELGIPVYLEKPIARTREDADAIVDAVARTGALCAVGYQWHSLAAVERIRDELAEQSLGLVVGRSLGPTTSRPWLLNRAQSGGQLLERASHHLDLQRLIGGQITAVRATAGWVPLTDRQRSDGDIEDVLSLELRFESGATGAVHVAWLRSEIRGIYDVTVAASTALLTLTLDPAFALEGVSRGRRVSEREARPPGVTAIAQFLDSVRGATCAARMCTPRDATATLAVAIACERALQSGREVAVQSA